MKKVILLGNLTKDVKEIEIGKGKNKQKALAIGLACNSKDKDGNKYTTFVNMLYFGKYKNIVEYLTKGKKVLVEGELNSLKDENDYLQLIVTPIRIELC